MICIIDYGAGNLRSVQKAVEYNGAKTVVSSNSRDIAGADKVIFPGVGAFGKAMEAIQQLDLQTAILDFIHSGKPFLGICLGMQLLFENSQENPEVAGFGVFKGQVKRFPKDFKVPHLGWNVLIKTQKSPLWVDIPDHAYFYFAHSYYVVPQNPEIVAGQSDYGIKYTVAVRRENVFGLQFHPEKSQKYGLKILENFIAV
ncbi:imidazole glycerol phosphate synthase subunit HisH [candidate division KSB1 bacterium]|nr:imidazole glycerol phosphate synthase subunit HisH [candidate division KSB1 bacterium]